MLVLQIILVHLVAALSPGPDILLTTRNSLAHGRLDGWATATGIVAGVSLQITLCLLGLVWALQSVPGLLAALSTAGGLYLIYLGIQALRAAPASHREQDSSTERRPLWHPFVEGLTTNLLNPKALLYFVALFTAVLSPETTLATRLSASVGMIGAQTVAFFTVSTCVGHPVLRRRLERIQTALLRVMAVVFLLFGLRLILPGIDFSDRLRID